MDNRAFFTIHVPGNVRFIAVSVVLMDLAKKLGDANLAAGRHEIVILGDGSIELNGNLFWRPKPSNVAEPQPKKKAG